MSTASRPSAADPDYRRRRARKAAAARHSIDTYVRSIVERAPELTPEQLARLRGLLRPVSDEGVPDEAP